MENQENTQTTTLTKGVKIFSIGCGVFGGIFFCAFAVTIVAVFGELLGMLPSPTELPITLNQLFTGTAVLVIIIGSIIGGIGGHTLFFRMAYKGGQARAIAHQKARQEFDEAVSEAVDAALKERGIDTEKS